MERLKELHFDWSGKHHNRISRSAEPIEKITDRGTPPGVLIGYTYKEEVDGQKNSFNARKAVINLKKKRCNISRLVGE